MGEDRKALAEELRACPNPWCDGGGPRTHFTAPPIMAGAWRVRCACGIKGPYCDTEAEAITAWNTRQAAELLDGPGVEGWRPIESAPKDGTQILAYSEKYGRRIVEWDAFEGAWFPASGLKLSCWQPLPQPPAAGEGSEQEGDHPAS